MRLIRTAVVEKEPLPEDTGGLDIFRDPEGGFHRIRDMNFLTEPPAEGTRNILAIQVKIAGRAHALYQAVTPEMVENLFWEK